MAGTLSSAQCQTTGARIWCAGTVTLTSLCHHITPLLSQQDEAGRPFSAELVHFDGSGLTYYPHFSSWRYFTIFPCANKSSAVCVTFKLGRESGVTLGMRSKDGLHFKQPAVVMVNGFGQANMVHNLAISPHASGFLLAGGLGNIWLTRGRRWRSSTSINVSLAQQERQVGLGWSQPRLIVNGDHPGCVERRVEPWLQGKGGGDAGSRCEYDGRLALVSWPERGRLLLYARANPALKGQRFVQVSSSDDDGSSWSPFELIRFRGYDYQTGNVYFFAAQVNPVRPGTLVAFFPVEHTFSACICMAISRDGLLWSEIKPVLPCNVAGERPTSHPMFGLAKIGKQMHLCVACGVELAFIPEAQSWSQTCHLLGADVHESVPDILHELPLTAEFYSQFPYLKSPDPRVVRYTFSATLLRQWTREALQQIQEADGVPTPELLPTTGRTTAACPMPQLTPASKLWEAYTQWLYGNGDNRSRLVPTAEEVRVVHVRMFSDAALRTLVLNPLRCSSNSSGLWACSSLAFSAKVNVHVPEHFAWRLGKFGSGGTYAPALSNAWTEVTHCAGSNFEGKAQPWFYVARGSGMFINLGRTMAFATHEEGVQRFLGKRCKTFQCDEELANMTAVAARWYDSLQFTHHCDGTCGLCQHELVMLRARSRHHAASPCHKGLEYRRGVGATLPCTCAVASVSSYGRGTCAVCAEVLRSAKALFPWEAPPTIPGSAPLHARAFAGQGRLRYGS